MTIVKRCLTRPGLIHLLVWLISVTLLPAEPLAQKLQLVVQTGHRGEVNSVAYSPDGKVLASGGQDTTIKLWNVETRQELLPLGGHNGPVMSVAFSPDGKILASGDLNGTIKLWNIETAQPITSLRDHGSSVNSVAFSPDGKTLASGNLDKTIKLWSVDGQKLLLSLPGHTGPVASVAFSLDGKTLASGSEDKTVRLWNVETWRPIRPLTGHADSVTSVAFSPDKKTMTLVSGSLDGTVKLWSLDGEQRNPPLPRLEDSIRSLAFSPDGKTLAATLTTREVVPKTKGVKLWDIETGREAGTIAAEASSLVFSQESVAFSPDGNTLAYGRSNGLIKLAKVASGEEIGTLAKHAARGGKGVTFSPDGKTLASVNGIGGVKLWNAETGTIRTFADNVNKGVSSFVISPDGKTLITGGLDQTIRLWSVESGQELPAFPPTGDTVVSVALSPDGATVASIGLDEKISLWNADKREKTRSLRGVGESVEEIVFSPDGDTLATIMDPGEDSPKDASVELWSVHDGKQMRPLPNVGSVRTIAFSPDKETKTLASVSDGENIIKLWSVDTAREIRPFSGRGNMVGRLTFSPDGKTLASTNGDNMIRLWDTATGKEIRSLIGRTDWVGSLAFSPDGSFLASEGDSSIKLWDTTSGRLLATLTYLDKDDWVAVDSEGRFDASPGAEKLMHYSYGLEVIDFEQLKEAYYEPGLMAKVMGFNKEPVRSMIPLKDIKLPPEVVEQRLSADMTKLSIRLKSREGGIGRTEVYVNGTRAVEDARDETLKRNPEVHNGEIVALSVDLPDSAIVKGRKNTIKVVTSNYLREIGKGNIQSRGAEIISDSPGRTEAKLPSIYAVVAGVSNYDGEAIRLKFAAKDAEDFSKALRLGANRLFCPTQDQNCLAKVNITTLTTERPAADEQPTKVNIAKAVAEAAAKAGPDDIFLLYLSGHGTTLGDGKDSYFYLSKEARSIAKEDLAKTYQTSGISDTEMTEWLTPNKGEPNDIFVRAQKKVIILDTCSAGNFTRNMEWQQDRALSGDQIRAIDFLRGKTGTFILMGSSANRSSYETNRYNQGLLTRSLLEGMQGRALQPATGNVDVGLLFDYATKRVPELAGEMQLVQQPVVKRPSGLPFIFAQMTDVETAKITLPTLKPILVTPALANTETMDDSLNLVPQLVKMFDSESSYEVMRRQGKGEPIYIYTPGDIPGGIRLAGFYSVTGDQIKIKANLRQDGKTVATLSEVNGTADKIVDQLMAEMRSALRRIPAK